MTLKQNIEEMYGKICILHLNAEKKYTASYQISTNANYWDDLKADVDDLSKLKEQLESMIERLE